MVHPTPKLGKVRLYLMYQTPEVYKTDVGEQKSLTSKGWKYACSFPDKDGFGKSVPLHPSIVLNSGVKQVHVHMEDTDTGDVFWDADYRIPYSLTWAALGKSELPSSTPALNGVDGMFKQPCVPKDDPTTHHFDISIQTQDGYYDDNVTPWAEMEGFSNFAGPKAHIGFDAKRFPLLETVTDPLEPQKEIVGSWTPGGSYSTGPVHHDRHERVEAGEEDPFYDTKTGRSHRGYYYHIIKPSGRERNMYEYLDKYAPPKMIHSSFGGRTPKTHAKGASGSLF